MTWLLLILKLLGGVGGTGLVGWGAHIAGVDRKVVTVAKGISPRGWLYIGCAVAVIGGLGWHAVHEHRSVKREVAAAYAQGRNDYAAKVEQQARQIEAKATAVTTQINQVIRDQHNEELGRIRASSDAIILRGPGKAECRDPAFSAPASGPQPANRSADAAVDRLPYPEWSALIAMPLDDATRFAAQHDAYRDEVKSWHTWWPQMNDAYERLRSEVSKGAKP
jgi:hypothetical protein